jgi:HSP20 family protein
MAFRDLIAGNRNSNGINSIVSGSLFDSLGQDFDKVFEGFFKDFMHKPGSLISRGAFGSFSPKIDVSEDEGQLSVTAELPGLDEKDIDVSLKDHVLTIKGEKKAEKEEKDKSYFRVERSFGSFQRSIRIPDDIEADKIKASFKNGLLNISIPKSEDKEKSVKKIEVKSA